MKRLAEFAVGDVFSAVREVDPYRSIYYAAASGDFDQPTAVQLGTRVLAAGQGADEATMDGIASNAVGPDEQAGPPARSLSITSGIGVLAPLLAGASPPPPATSRPVGSAW